MHCDWLRRTGATERTIFHRRENLRRVAERLPRTLAEATPSELDSWQSDLTVSTSSIATYTNHVRAFYRWASENEHLEVDPSTRLPRPRVAKRSARPIPEKDLQLALACAPEPVRTWLVLAAFMGLRAMEVARIRREDVCEVGGRLVLSGVGKGDKPFRMPVPEEVVPVLRPWLGGQVGPLWRTSTGRAIRSANVTTEVGRFFRGIGMPYSLHWLRHAFGTAFYRATKDLLLTQDVMRHSSPNSTRLYVDTTHSEATAAMDKLSAALRKPLRRQPARAPRGRAA